nr:phage integrase N-terminal SAM-like domain-containing protein [Sinimarinibacterium sp. NLF-5-8]
MLDRVRATLRLHHYSLRTEQAYVDWIKRFILFHDKRHPREMGAVEVTAFLSHLAMDRQVSASTQNYRSPPWITSPDSPNPDQSSLTHGTSANAVR